MLSLAPAIIAYMPDKTWKKSTDYVTLEGSFVECCTNDVQYSYKVNTWANTVFHDREDFDPYDTYYNADKALRIAMTEYGEFAGNNSANTNHAGIAYGADYNEWENTESWASTAVKEGQWVQGWLLWVNYTYWLGPTQYPRILLAYAVYSSGVSVEAGRGVWNWDARYTSAETPQNTLTEGYMTPDGVKVLYDSARLAVIRANVLIHDNHLGDDFARITFTVIFDKCGKVATVFKDIKMLFGKAIIINDFAFSERYELDLAAKINPTLASYVHYYDNYGQSVYYHPELGMNNYDIVQAYDQQRRYIFAAAYWPNCTEFDVFTNLVPSITGGVTTVLPNNWRQADLQGPLGTPAEPNEPWVPLICVQWRYNNSQYPELLNFLSNPGPNREIRFVEALAMTDFNANAPHHAMDYNDTVYKQNVVDAEIAYLFDYQVFNPEDLNAANYRAWGVPDTPTPYQTSEDIGPFMYTAVGVNAGIVDDAAAEFLSPNYNGTKYSAFPILDMAFESAYEDAGTIPYALESEYVGDSYNYLFDYNSYGWGIGQDDTTYYYVAMKEFAFDVYDDDYITRYPQPIKGGWSWYSDYFYPSINPLSERWSWYPMEAMYDNVDYDPNGIITVGGGKANWVTRYFNDYMYAIEREGDFGSYYVYYAWINGESPLGFAPTSDPDWSTLDFFPLSTWATSPGFETFNYTEDYAVIALGRDEGGLRGLEVNGWNARDTYWASEWAAKFILGPEGGQFPAGTVALILHITYQGENLEPVSFQVVEMLGTITQFGANEYIDKYFDWDHGPFAGQAYTAWYTNHIGTWDKPYSMPDVWWFAKFPTCDDSKIYFDS